MYLLIRTDNPQAELYLANNSEVIATKFWQAHKALASTIYTSISQFLKQNNCDFKDLNGVACYVGSGSFTGIRIGATVANTIATATHVPALGVMPSEWLNLTLLHDNMQSAAVGSLVQPVYDRPATTTLPKK